MRRKTETILLGLADDLPPKETTRTFRRTIRLGDVAGWFRQGPREDTDVNFGQTRLNLVAIASKVICVGLQRSPDAMPPPYHQIGEIVSLQPITGRPLAG